MKSISRTVLCWHLAVMALNVCGLAQNNDSIGTQESCRLFTQEFYDWYLPNTHVKQAKLNGMPALKFALKGRRYAFESELARQLDAVRALEKRDREPLLDFDPVLNSQDPASHYAVEKAELKDGRCWADVYGEWRVFKKSEKPSVVAELTFRNRQWQFTDFWYPDSEHRDSKSLLRTLGFLLKKENHPNEH